MKRQMTTSITVTINSEVSINYINNGDSYRSGERGMSEKDILNKKSTDRAFRRMCR